MLTYRLSSRMLVFFRFEYGGAGSAARPLHAHLKSSPEEIWPALLHKACAKACGGYDQLMTKSVADILLMLTGYAATQTQTDAIRQTDAALNLSALPEATGDEEQLEALWKAVETSVSQGWDTLCTVDSAKWGLEPGTLYRVKHTASVDGQVFSTTDPAAEESTPAAAEEGGEAEEAAPEELPETKLVCLCIPEGAGFEGSLSDTAAGAWTTGLADALGDKHDGSSGTVWVTLHELLHAVDSVIGFKSCEEQEFPPQDEDGGWEDGPPQLPDPALVCRRQLHGTWHAGSAYGANPHFELSGTEESQVLLTVVSTNPAKFTLSVLDAGTSCVHGSMLPLKEPLVTSDGSTACAEITLSGSESRTIVVSHTVPAGVEGSFVLSAVSMSGTIELKPKPLPAIETTSLQRYEYQWKGNAGGGPRSCSSWRNNPVWLVSAETQCTIGAVLEQMSSEAAAVGVSAVRNTDNKFTSCLLPQIEVLTDTGCSKAPEVGAEFNLDPAAGPVLVVPCASAPNVTQEYRLHLVGDQSFTTELLPAAEWQSCNGQWRPTGCGSNVLDGDGMLEWMNNPQFRLRLADGKTEGRVCVTLSQVSVAPKVKPPPEPEPTEEAEAEGAAEEAAEEGAAEEAPPEEEAAAEAEPAPEPEPEYYEDPAYGIAVVQVLLTIHSLLGVSIVSLTIHSLPLTIGAEPCGRIGRCRSRRLQCPSSD